MIIAPDARPTLIYAGSWAALRPLIPPQGAVIDVPPGDYDDPWQARTDGDILVRALDPDDPPTFWASVGSDVFGLNAPRGGLGTGILRLASLVIGPGGGDGVSLNKGRAIVLDDCRVSGVSHGLQSSHDRTATVVVRGSVFEACRSHNLYLGRNRGFLFADSVSRAAGGSEVKSIALANVLRRSTVEGEGMLVDIAGCCDTVLAENTFRRVGSSTNKYLVAIRARQSLTGADMRWDGSTWERFGYYHFGPDWELVRPLVQDPRYQDPAYWDAVKAAGLTDPLNRHLFRHCRRDNLIESFAPANEVAFYNEGTAPVDTFADSGQQDAYLPLPPHWAERATIFSARNRVVGPRLVPSAGRDAGGGPDSIGRVVEVEDDPLPPCFSMDLGLDDLFPSSPGQPFLARPFQWKE